MSSPVWGGIAFGAMGFIAGAYVGGRTTSNCFGEECGLERAFYGAAIGGTFGMALGVHVGNRNRGNLGLDFLTGAGVWGAGMLIGSATDWDGQAPLFILTAIPIFQMITTVHVERQVGRQRDRAADARPSVSIIPRPHGAGLFVSVPLPPIR